MADRDVFQALAGALITCQPQAFYPSDLKHHAIRGRCTHLEPPDSLLFDGYQNKARYPSLALFSTLENIVGTEDEIREYLIKAVSEMFVTARKYPEGRERFRKDMESLGCTEFHRGTEPIAAAVDRYYGLGDNYDQVRLDEDRDNNALILRDLRELAYKHGVGTATLSWILRDAQA